MPTLTTPPALYSHTNDDIPVVLTTDQINLANAYAKIELTVSGSPVVGEELTIKWLSNSITFVIAALPTLAIELPTKGALSNSDYAALLRDELIRNYDIYSALFVSASSNVVTLQYRTPGILDFEVENNLTGISEVITDVTIPVQPDNLNAFIQVLDLNGSVVAELHSPYVLATSKTMFDLSGLVNLRPALPTTASMRPPSGSWIFQDAVGSYGAYTIRYADRSGIPAITGKLEESNVFHLVAGSRSPAGLHAALVEPAAQLDYFPHNRPAGIEQPDWMYVYAAGYNLVNCNLDWKIIWSDGTVEDFVGGGTGFTIPKNTAVWIPCGPLQFDLINRPQPSADAYPITLRVKLVGNYSDNLNVTFAQRVYDIDSCPQWPIYLFCSNAFGGRETFLFDGKSKRAYSATRQNARRVVDVNTKLDSFYNYNAIGRQVLTLRSGFHNLEYISHLRQTILGELHVIDMVNDRFLPYVCDVSDVEIFTDDQELYALSITILSSWVDNNFSE